MGSPIKQKRSLHPLNTHWINRSHSSITSTSDTAFHSALTLTPSTHMELHTMTQKKDSSILQLTSSIPPSQIQQHNKVDSTSMSRQDSGYSDAQSKAIPQSPVLTSSRRTSTSISTSSTPRSSLTRATKRRTYTQSTTTSSRPTHKRATRSSPQTSQLPSSTTVRRPSMQSRHTAAPYYTSQNTNNQFFHFPSLSPPPSPPHSSSSTSRPNKQTQPQPPATIQYWTSDSTRRLEYAAIDAASQGVRGFFIRLVPDCILPKEKRRTRFCEGDEGSDAGSVRRYRLDLPEEKGVKRVVVECGERSGVRRWISFGKRRDE